MTDQSRHSLREAIVTWGTVIAMALVTAWSAQPLLTVLLQIAEGEEPRFGSAGLLMLLAAGLLVFAAAVIALRRRDTARLRIEAGCLWSGVLLWLSVPVMGLMVWLVAQADQGADQGGATAAFFMLMIFGGYNAIIGSILLLVAFLIRRQRREEARMTFRP